MRAGFIGYGKENIVLILKRVQIFIPSIFRLLLLFNNISPTSHRSYNSILDSTVGARDSAVLGNMRHIIFLRHSCFLKNHAIVLGTNIIRRLSVGSFAGVQDASPRLLLPQNPDGSVSVRYRGRSSRGNLIDLGCCNFIILFYLNGGQEVKPFFMWQGKIVLLMVIKLILHECGDTVLNCNTNFTDCEFLVADFPNSCLIALAFYRRWWEVIH